MVAPVTLAAAVAAELVLAVLAALVGYMAAAAAGMQ